MPCIDFSLGQSYGNGLYAEFPVNREHGGSRLAQRLNVVADGAGITAGDGSGKTIGDTDSVNVMQRAAYQREECLCCLVGGDVKGLPEVGSGLDEGYEVVAGDNCRRMVDYLVFCFQLYGMPAERGGYFFKRAQQRFFSLYTEG